MKPWVTVPQLSGPKAGAGPDGDCRLADAWLARRAAWATPPPRVRGRRAHWANADSVTPPEGSERLDGPKEEAQRVREAQGLGRCFGVALWERRR